VNREAVGDLLSAEARELTCCNQASHVELVHTGGIACITTRREPAEKENKTSHLHHQLPQDWRNDGCEPGANRPHIRILRGR
jgi:hypothetical protein